VEAVASYPRAPRQLRGVASERRQERRDVVEAARVEVQVARGETEEMEMRVDQAGQHGRARTVDPGRARSCRARAERDDATAGDRDRRRDRAPRVARQDPRALEDDGDGI